MFRELRGDLAVSRTRVLVPAGSRFVSYTRKNPSEEIKLYPWLAAQLVGKIIKRCVPGVPAIFFTFPQWNL